MDLTSPTIIKELLGKHQSHPNKTMGQNFLIDKGTLKKIMTAADINKQETVLEVGPGIGTLTIELADKAEKVIAIEKDSAIVEILKETTNKYPHIEIIPSDILRYNSNLEKYKVVANLPYYITSPVIRMFLEAKNQPESMVLMVQKEVAQRICQTPPRMSILAVSVQYYARAQIISFISKECFWPKPKVDSAIIKIIPRIKPDKKTADIFFTVVKAGFLHPRKQLANNLCQSLGKEKKEIQTWLIKNGLKPQQRAETLSIQDWINLANSLPLKLNQ